MVIGSQRGLMKQGAKGAWGGGSGGGGNIVSGWLWQAESLRIRLRATGGGVYYENEAEGRKGGHRK